MHYSGCAYGGFPMGMIYQVIIFIIFFLVFWWLIKNSSKQDSASEELKKRLAKGEITSKEYKKLKKEIEE